MEKTEITFDKPLYVGLAILDLSKILLYRFHYEYMRKGTLKNQFSQPPKLLYCDTDSLIYQVFCDDFYEIMKADLNEEFDTSDYPLDNQFKIPLVNKKIVGKMKDENASFIMIEFVGLRSKMYGYRTKGKQIVKKAKGIKMYVVKKKIKFQDYIDSLKNKSVKYEEQTKIASKMHRLFTVRERKIALSPFDNKRYLIEDSTETLPWGHKNIPMNVQ